MSAKLSNPQTARPRKVFKGRYLPSVVVILALQYKGNTGQPDYDILNSNDNIRTPLLALMSFAIFSSSKAHRGQPGPRGIR